MKIAFSSRYFKFSVEAGINGYSSNSCYVSQTKKRIYLFILKRFDLSFGKTG